MGRAEAFYAIHILTSDDMEQVSESPRLTVAIHTSQRLRLTCGGFSESSAGYLSSRRTLESCKNRREVDLVLLNLQDRPKHRPVLLGRVKPGTSLRDSWGSETNTVYSYSTKPEVHSGGGR